MRTKLTFEFDEDAIDDPKIYIHALDINYGVTELRESIRSKLKHGHNFKSADEALEWVREELFNIKGVQE